MSKIVCGLHDIHSRAIQPVAVEGKSFQLPQRKYFRRAMLIVSFRHEFIAFPNLMTLSKARAKPLGMPLRGLIIFGLHPFDSEDIAAMG